MCVVLDPPAVDLKESDKEVILGEKQGVVQDSAAVAQKESDEVSLGEKTPLTPPIVECKRLKDYIRIYKRTYG